MSRIGKQPVIIPQGVKASIADGIVSVEGPIGKLQYTPARGVSVAIVAGEFIVSLVGTDKQSQANYGTTRALINNMVNGVSKGFQKSLELVGVGYTAKLQGNKLVLNVGHSHEDIHEVPAGVTCIVDKTKIDMKCADRAVLGSFAATVRASKKPEPYLGKGIKYSNEVVRRKAGKTGKK